MYRFIGSSSLLTWKSVGGNCCGLTKAGITQGAASCHWTEPSFPEAFHGIPRAAGQPERQVASFQMFPWPTGLKKKKTAERAFADRSGGAVLRGAKPPGKAQSQRQAQGVLMHGKLLFF